MVTMGGMTEFEHEVPKIVFVSKKAAILTAGDAIRGARLVRELKSVFPVDASIETIAIKTKDHYVRLQDQQVELDQFRLKWTPNFGQ